MWTTFTSLHWPWVIFAACRLRSLRWCSLLLGIHFRGCCHLAHHIGRRCHFIFRGLHRSLSESLCCRAWQRQITLMVIVRLRWFRVLIIDVPWGYLKERALNRCYLSVAILVLRYGGLFIFLRAFSVILLILIILIIHILTLRIFLIPVFAIWPSGTIGLISRFLRAFFLTSSSRTSPSAVPLLSVSLAVSLFILRVMICSLIAWRLLLSLLPLFLWLRISCSNVHSAITDLGNLHFSYQPLSNVISIESNETKTPARTCVCISHDLDILDLTVLLKMLSQVRFSQGIVEAANKDPGPRDPWALEFLNLFVSPLLVNFMIWRSNKLVGGWLLETKLLALVIECLLMRTFWSNLSPFILPWSALIKERIGWFRPITNSDFNITA